MTGSVEYRCPCLLCRPDCNKHDDDNRRVCQGCRDRLRRDLHEIPDLYAMLGAEMGIRTGRAGPRVSGSREAPIPDVDVISLRGPGTMTVYYAIDPATGRLDMSKADPDTGLLPEDDQHGASPIFAALESWERDWRHTRGLAISGAWPTIELALTEIVWFLGRHLDWACDEHDAIDEFAAEVEQVRQSMKAARGDVPDTVYVGRCPTPFDDGPCGAKLYASTWQDTIRCPQCRVRRDRAEWEHLGKTMREGGAA